ncbi:MAG: hypothetical protein COB39_12945 [Marinosulfonomonas sp.]|nr:MAG: hypothetical protein COB39_12945 [Marinosulfonomonas sp.]
MFDTPDGPRSIERLKPGDLLMTKDNGQWTMAAHRKSSGSGHASSRCRQSVPIPRWVPSRLPKGR